MTERKTSNINHKSIRNRIKRWWNNDTLFLSLIGIITLITFLRAFSIDFMLDDYFFLRVGRADTLGDILRFFYPVKDYFYRPIPTETFYFVIHLFHENTVMAHIFMFTLYFIGLIFLYKIILEIFHKRGLARLFLFLYAIHFVHVFQLYEIATAIEIFLFTFLVISFFYYLHRKIVLSIVFFVLALLSKETAILFPLFLLLYYVFKGKKEGLRLLDILWYAGISVGFGIIYRFGVSEVVRNEPTYRIQKSPRLIVNNLMWYSLWSFGIPNFFPDYFVSIFSPPIAEFWKQLKNQTFIYWSIFYASYLIVLLPTLITGLFFTFQKKKNTVLVVLFCLFGFLLFITPTLPIFHKWMVRLTIPLIFVLLAESYLLFVVYQKATWGKILVSITVILFLISNFYAIRLHENSGLFILETNITRNTRSYIGKYFDSIRIKGIIHFQDKTETGIKISSWEGSEKLSTSFHGQDFLDYYFPDQKIRAFYAYQTPATPEGAFIIKSYEILLKNSIDCRRMLLLEWCW